MRVLTVTSGPDKSELPIACTLSAGDFETRLAELRALGRRSLISVERPADSPIVLRFRNGSQARAELERIVAAEAECCAFFELKITAGEALELSIDGPEEARALTEELVDALAAEATA